MTPTYTFVFGLLLLVLFAWYFATDFAARKRWLGLVLTVLLVAFCIEQIMPPEKKIRLGLDLQGGTSFLIKLIAQPDPETGKLKPISPDDLAQAVEVIRKRVDQYGTSEPSITPQGTDQILVQIAGLSPEKINAAKEQLQRVAKLDFAMVFPNSAALIPQILAGEAPIDPNYKIVPYVFKDSKGEKVETQLLVKKRPDMSGDHVTSANAYFDQQGYGVALNLDSTGAKLFGELTNQVYKTQGQLAILLDGEVQSAPGVREGPIYGGRATITGGFSETEARNLASVLENPLKVPVEIQETRSVSSTLGADSIRSGILAGLTGLGLVLVFVLLYYRFSGLIAIIGLAVNIVLLFGLMVMFNFVLTLPGIAGIILTIGMAVDANVLIYERLREELKAGKSLSAALDGAYDKAFSAIFDANVTTLITSVILMWQATGSVRGFAITLTLGIIASMFSALLVTRTLFRWLTVNKRITKLSMLDLIPKRQFDFLGKRFYALAFSILLFAGSIGIFAWHGAGNFGIDFRGGDLMVLDSKVPVTVEEARAALAKSGLGDTTIQLEREGMKEMLSVRSEQGTSAQVLTALQQAYPDRGIFSEQEETVGAAIGMEFAYRALFALGLGIVGILIYTTVRFEFGFALGVVVALLHDVVLTMGVFSLVGGQLSLIMVGAILTIAGYSVNDTIVIFDRIREGLKSGERGSIVTIMNRSINETLGRTILTGGTTILSVAALYFFGGAVLRDFAFAILIGILVGTYSSIFVAAPIVLWWSKFRRKSLRKEVLESEAAAA